MEYEQRLHQFTATKTWEIREDALVWRDDKGGKGGIRFSEIKLVRLRFQPTRVERRRFALVIQIPGETCQITNIHYRGVMDFEERSDDFTRFVEVFHEYLVVANPDVIYRSGSTIPSYIFNVVISIFVLLVILGVGLIAVFSGIIWLVAIKIALVIFYLPTLYKVLVKNKPMTYDPLNIPDHIKPSPGVLPEAS